MHIAVPYMEYTGRPFGLALGRAGGHLFSASVITPTFSHENRALRKQQILYMHQVHYHGVMILNRILDYNLDKQKIKGLVHSWVYRISICELWIVLLAT